MAEIKKMNSFEVTLKSGMWCVYNDGTAAFYSDGSEVYEPIAPSKSNNNSDFIRFANRSRKVISCAIDGPDCKFWADDEKANTNNLILCKVIVRGIWVDEPNGKQSYFAKGSRFILEMPSVKDADYAGLVAILNSDKNSEIYEKHFPGFVGPSTKIEMVRVKVVREPGFWSVDENGTISFFSKGSLIWKPTHGIQQNIKEGFVELISRNHQMIPISSLCKKYPEVEASCWENGLYPQANELIKKSGYVPCEVIKDCILIEETKGLHSFLNKGSQIWIFAEWAKKAEANGDIVILDKMHEVA